MNIITNKKIYLSIAMALMATSVVLLFVYPLNFGIDFTGGALAEVAVAEGVTRQNLEVATGAMGEVSVRATGLDRFVIKTGPLDDEKRQELSDTLATVGVTEILRFTSIGPTIGAELKRGGMYAVVAVAMLIVLYIAFVFRKVSKPVQSWKYGVVAVVALLHDLLIPLGVFAVLGSFTGVVIDSLFITALLAILGLSVNDTIVVFDRIRENLEKKPNGDFAITVERSVNETLMRSLNTSITTLLVLLALFILGPESTRYFVFALMLGLIAGTYSSLFVAAPLLVLWQERARER